MKSPCRILFLLPVLSNSPIWGSDHDVVLVVLPFTPNGKLARNGCLHTRTARGRSDATREQIRGGLRYVALLLFTPSVRIGYSLQIRTRTTSQICRLIQ